jgi:hypothetical protein
VSKSLRIAAFLVVAQAAFAQAPAPQPANAAVDVFHKAWFVSANQVSMSGVPISYERSNPNGIGSVPASSSGSGTGFTVGVSGVFGNNDNWLLQLDWDYASAKLSDWRVKNRAVAFNSIDFTVGYATHGPVSLVPFVFFGPGWYSQSGYKEYNFNSPTPGPDSSAYEALQRMDYNMALGFGLKAGFAKYFALTGEMRWYKEDTGGGSGSCGPNCTVIDVGEHAPAKRYGMRTAVGVQLYFGW